MAREKINEADLGKITGGSIIFNEDMTTCGRNCNDQYRVVDLDEVLDYLQANNTSMSERSMLNHLVEVGLLEEI